MIKDFPEELKSTDTAGTLADNGPFNQGQGGELPTECVEAFHATVAKGSFLCERARPDTLLCHAQG
jgi:hypothetical protein